MSSDFNYPGTFVGSSMAEGSAATGISASAAGMSGASAGMLGAGFGISSAFGMLNSFIAGKMQSDINVANINAQTIAYQQMAQYSRQNVERLGLNKRAFEFNQNSMSEQAMQAEQAEGRRGARVMGTYRAIQADSGAAMSGSKQDLMDQIENDNLKSAKNLNVNIARSYMQSTMQYQESIFNQNQNYTSAINQYKNQINEYNNRMGNAQLASLQGGISGMGTGINIAQGMRGLATWGNSGSGTEAWGNNR